MNNIKIIAVVSCDTHFVIVVDIIRTLNNKVEGDYTSESVQ
jgi:hypothetical protein